MSFEIIAEKLNLPLSAVKRESMRNYLERKVLETKTELFSLAGKYKVKGLKELDSHIKAGKIKEDAESRDDFFRIDFLSSQLLALKQLLKSL